MKLQKHIHNTIPRLLFELVVLTLLEIYASASTGTGTASPKDFIVWGPGLEAAVRTPARYFFVQAVDTNGHLLTDSVGKLKFTVEEPVTNRRVRCRTDIIDRQNGTYILRYHLFDSYKDLSITISYGNLKVADSPYLLKGMVYHEFCRCPQPNINQWLTENHCPSKIPEQIRSDLSPFKSINITESLKLFQKRDRQGSICHYKIINNKIYLKTYGSIVDFKTFSNEILLYLTAMVHLPDIEFLLNLGDWPRAKNIKPLIPILSWCGSTDTVDIVMPTYDLMKSTLMMLSRVSLDILSVQQSTVPWKDRVEKGFFRGRDSNEVRLKLVEMARAHPDILVADITIFFFFKHDKEKYGETVKHMSFHDFFQYKYQINIDGTVAAYRFPYLMGGNSPIFKQDSKYYEHFYSELSPWKHYIPVKNDLSDLLEKIQWAKDNDDKVKEIAERARNYINEHLLPHHLLCYHVQLFQEYSKLLVSPPSYDPSFELIVDDPNDTYNNYKCDCHYNNKIVKDEL